MSNSKPPNKNLGYIRIIVYPCKTKPGDGTHAMTLRCYQNNFTGWWWITALHRGTSISQLSLSIPVAHEKAKRGWDGFNKRCTRRSKRAQGAWNGGRKETPLSWYRMCTAWGRSSYRWLWSFLPVTSLCNLGTSRVPLSIFWQRRLWCVIFLKIYYFFVLHVCLLSFSRFQPVGHLFVSIFSFMW